MLIKTNPASQALNQAYAALQRGDKSEARHKAQLAASLEPNNEEPWLILGAASQPRASIAYLKRALEINPQSERARGGLEWATRRLKDSLQPVVRNEEASSISGEADASPKTISQKIKPSANALRKAAPALRIFIPVLILSLAPSANALRKAAPALRIFIPVLILSLALLLVAAWTFRPAMESAGADVRGDPVTTQEGSIAPMALADPALQSSALLPTETNAPTASPSPTAFQPATPMPTSEPLRWLREGEFFAARLPEGGEKLITVSLQEQRLYAYQDGTLIATFVVSTGSNTSTGSFHILDKIPNVYSDIWNFWMPNWMGIYFAGSLENGFHSLPVLPNGESIWSDALGTPVSYGCVVLGVPEAQALYDWAEVGTTVQINP